jgi:hypothetical protein
MSKKVSTSTKASTKPVATKAGAAKVATSKAPTKVAAKKRSSETSKSEIASKKKKGSLKKQSSESSESFQSSDTSEAEIPVKKKKASDKKQPPKAEAPTKVAAKEKEGSFNSEEESDSVSAEDNKEDKSEDQEKDNEESDEDDLSSVAQLMDIDFKGRLPPYQSTDIPAIVYRLPKSENTLAFVKCSHTGCNNVISAMSEEFQREIDNAQRKCMSQNGRQMTTAEYNSFVSTTYDKYGNIFEKGGLDRSLTVFNTETKALIKKKKEEFFNIQDRHMTQDEYNDMVDSLSAYDDNSIIQDLKKWYFLHFSKKMTISDYEDYTGESDSALGRMTRELIKYTEPGFTDEQFNQLIEDIAPDLNIGKREVAFYKIYGRNIVNHFKFSSVGNVIKRITSTNSYVLEKECCRVNIMQRVIVPQGRDFNNRRIEEVIVRDGGAFMHGNVVMKKLEKPIPYNPYTFKPEMADEQIIFSEKPSVRVIRKQDVNSGKPIVRSAKEVKEHREKEQHIISSKKSTVRALKNDEHLFPPMPGEDNDFEEEVFRPFISVGKIREDPFTVSNEMITHKIYTGIKGMETYKISGRIVSTR